jgi:probable rRNA maturation factor
MTHALVLRNRQHTRALNTPLLRRIILHLLQNDFTVTDYELCFHFVTADEMARVNQQFLQHEGSTDVITFDYGEGNPEAELRGEIFISIPDAVEQAREFGTTWQSELMRYIVHGLLHLRGFDDLQPTRRRVMKREENRLLKKTSAQFPVRSLARSRPSTSVTRS